MTPLDILIIRLLGKHALDYLVSSTAIEHTRIKPSRDRIRLDNEDLVYEYFRLTLKKDIIHLLDLFTEDAIIHEPFSKHEDSGLKVNTIIMITMRLYDLLHCRYPYEKLRIDWMDVTRTFRSGQKIIIRSIFKLGHDSKDQFHSNNRRINFFHIQLIRLHLNRKGRRLVYINGLIQLF